MLPTIAQFRPAESPLLSAPDATRSQRAAGSGAAVVLLGLDREIPQSSKGRQRPCGLGCADAAPSAARSFRPSRWIGQPGSRDARNMTAKVARAERLQSSRSSCNVRRPRRPLQSSNAFSLSPARDPFDSQRIGSASGIDGTEATKLHRRDSEIIASRFIPLAPGHAPQPFFRASDESVPTHLVICPNPFLELAF